MRKKRKKSKPILYGQCIQLLHVRSQKILCVNVHEKSEGDAFSMELTLKSWESLGVRSKAAPRSDEWFDSWFEVQEPLSIDLGYLRDGDEVCLLSHRWRRFVHFSPLLNTTEEEKGEENQKLDDISISSRSISNYEVNASFQVSLLLFILNSNNTNNIYDHNSHPVFS